MNKLLTAALLLVTSAGLNLVACGKCEKGAEKPVCRKEVTSYKYTCPEKHVSYSCPSGYHDATGEKKQQNGNKKMNKKGNGKSQSY